MCGGVKRSALVDRWIEALGHQQQRFNFDQPSLLAATQQLTWQTGMHEPGDLVVVAHQSNSNQLHIEGVRWGQQRHGMQQRIINARAENLPTTWQASFAQSSRRVIVPIRAFRENTTWLESASSEKDMLAAGLLVPSDEPARQALVIITAPMPPEWRHIHDRAILFIPRKLQAMWFAAETPQVELLTRHAASWLYQAAA